MMLAFGIKKQLVLWQEKDTFFLLSANIFHFDWVTINSLHVFFGLLLQ